jgi:hypothetical protein
MARMDVYEEYEKKISYFSLFQSYFAAKKFSHLEIKNVASASIE